MKDKPISGKTCIKILCKYFDFKITRQKGSHIILVKYNPEKIGTVVPNHKELKLGTLKGILELAKVSYLEFYNALKKK